MWCGGGRERKNQRKTPRYPLLHPPWKPSTASVVLWVHFALFCLAQACPCMSRSLFSASLPILPAGPGISVCCPIPLHMFFPLSRTPFCLFWLSPFHLSRLSAGILFSWQPFLVSGWGKACSGLPQLLCVSQVHSVLAFVNAHLSHRSKMPPSSGYECSTPCCPPSPHAVPPHAAR